MKVRLAVRGFAEKTLIFSERIEVDEHELETIAERQVKRMADYPKHMIELEFLDEPNVNQRFFRFGTSPVGMVLPFSIKL